MDFINKESSNFIRCITFVAMKLRILDDYIRLRLSQTEVEQFGEEGQVKSSSKIGGSTLSYELTRSNEAQDVLASFENNTISIQVPIHVSSNWLKPEVVGFKNEDQSDIRILVEKDFQCLHKRPEEDESDSFPNPLAE